MHVDDYGCGEGERLHGSNISIAKDAAQGQEERKKGEKEKVRYSAPTKGT